MTRELTMNLIRSYMTAWVQQDRERLLSVLCADVVIIECDGTTYTGIDQVRRWFSAWHAAPVNGTVTQWDAHRILADVAQDAAAVEWFFSCVCHGEASSFHGASFVRFVENRITSIREYRTV